jgi:hypothetical protein
MLVMLAKASFALGASDGFSDALCGYVGLAYLAQAGFDVFVGFLADLGELAVGFLDFGFME